MKFSLIAIPATLVLCATLAFAGKPGEKVNTAGAKSAVIVIEGEYTAQGISKNEAISVIDPATIKKLEAFFPKYQKSPSSSMQALWIRGYRVYFNFPKGKTLLVEVSHNGGGHLWDMGKGNQQTNGKFKAFVDGLKKGKGK